MSRTRMARYLCRAAVLVCLVVPVTGCGSSPAAGGAVAAVLDAKGMVSLVDLELGRVIRSFRLRSWASDIAADEGIGAFVTAQSGGVGTDADDAVGVIGVRGRRFVRYVSLPRPNPLGIEVVGRGRALVDHGWMEPQGMFVCLVDTERMQVERAGHVPDNNEPMSFAGGCAWSSGMNVLTDEPSLRRMDVRALVSTEVADAAVGPADRRTVECLAGESLFGWVRRRGLSPMLARYDRHTGALDATATIDFDDGPGRLASVGPYLVTVDFSGEDLTRSAGRLLVFDPDTLGLLRAVELRGVPSDVAAWGDRAVVVNQRDQTLQVLDPYAGKVMRTIPLPEMAPLPLKVAVLPR